MGTRHELHEEFKQLLGTSSKRGNEARCFFQPPESLKLAYPCIIYSRERPDVIRADNLMYRRVRRYAVNYLTYDPDDPLIEQIEDHFPMCRLVRTNTASGLNHYHYDLFY